MTHCQNRTWHIVAHGCTFRNFAWHIVKIAHFLKLVIWCSVCETRIVQIWHCQNRTLPKSHIGKSAWSRVKCRKLWVILAGEINFSLRCFSLKIKWTSLMNYFRVEGEKLFFHCHWVLGLWGWYHQVESRLKKFSQKKSWWIPGLEMGAFRFWRSTPHPPTVSSRCQGEGKPTTEKSRNLSCGFIEGKGLKRNNIEKQKRRVMQGE